MTEVLRVSKESSEVLMFARLHGNGDSESLYVSSRFVAHVVTAANTDYSQNESFFSHMR